ncbi:MAG: cupin domain-containing protein [Desulfarculus sp.]|jgi:quercetin dioxygenase-like cupin family protein|nr:MAG: cupin domain-containing protein [Desulfarculus sp.]
MKVTRAQDAVKNKIEKFPYKGKDYAVKDVFIQWLSNAGPAESPEYGLRLFTVGPGGEIPIHKHFYYQTMFILEGRLTGFAFDSETDRKTEEFAIGPHDVAFIPTMEPHGFVNPSDNEACSFLCCIANVYDDEA